MKKKLRATRVLIVDDSPELLEFSAVILRKEGYEVETCTSSRKCLLMLHGHQYDIVLLDIVMPEIDGIEVGSHIRNNLINVEIVMMTGEPDENKIDACKQMGIAHFLFKPFCEQQLIYTVYAALYSKRMQQALAEIGKQARSDSRIIGISSACRHLHEQIGIIAPSDMPVLIEGETGTGKELIAREIHDRSNRRDKPFLPINCATLGNLAESELFGHVSGAFTGARRSTRGHVGSADGGTLFLDEIGEMAFALQAKLLRFLDSGEYMRVGESVTRNANVRIISATNQDLKRQCREKRFRQDLYYRILGGYIQTSPLRTHPEDIPPLIWHFIHILSTKYNRTFEISPDAISALSNYNWPGNVRQLKHVIYLLCEASLDGRINFLDVVRVMGPNGHRKTETYRQAKEKAIRDFDMRYFSEIMVASGGKLKKILDLSGMHKKNFYSKIKQLGLSPRDLSRGVPDKISPKKSGYSSFSPSNIPEALDLIPERQTRAMGL